MALRYFIVDAFTDKLFGGNQAGVCLLDEWVEDSLMQNIAAENNLAETAFVVRRGDVFELRWFTPAVEIDLCGHATLAAAYVISEFADKGADRMDFHTKSGILTVTLKSGMLVMELPARKPVPAGITPLMREVLRAGIREALRSRDLMLVVDSEDVVRNLEPDMALMRSIPDAFGVIVTAAGNDCDFVSRFFAPNAGIPEDPVTGSSHATLVPFWAERLGKDKLTARQLSHRGGMLVCENMGDRVSLTGSARLYLEGKIFI